MTVRKVLLKTRDAFTRTPWEIDRLFGLGVFGLGIVFGVWPREVVHYGFRFIGPIIHQVWWMTALIGATQMLVGIMEWSRTRQWVAFAAFFVYAAISRNNDSPSGEWIYGVCALAETLIVLKRY